MSTTLTRNAAGTPDDGPRHHLGLQGANTLPTPWWVLGREAILEATELSAMAAVTGPPGTGKTFLLDSVMPELDCRTERVEFEEMSTPRSLARQLYRQLSGEEAPISTRFDLTPMVVEQLRGPLVVMVDEAQRLHRKNIDFLRYLHDHRDTDFTLVFAGGEGCWRQLGTEPQLRRRIYRPVFFQLMDEQEVLELIPAYHPMWQDASEETVLRADQEFAVGLLSNWATLTQTMQQQQDKAPHATTEQLLDRALYQATGGAGVTSPDRAVAEAAAEAPGKVPAASGRPRTRGAHAAAKTTRKRTRGQHDGPARPARKPAASKG